MKQNVFRFMPAKTKLIIVEPNYAQIMAFQILMIIWISKKKSFSVVKSVSNISLSRAYKAAIRHSGHILGFASCSWVAYSDSRTARKLNQAFQKEKNTNRLASITANWTLTRSPFQIFQKDSLFLVQLYQYQHVSIGPPIYLHADSQICDAAGAALLS